MRTKICFAFLICLFSQIASGAMEILVPAYFDPTTDPALWEQMTTAANTVPLTVIMNPDSGPGTSVDASYSTAINTLRAAGGKVVGYVYTQGGDRAIASVKSDIDRYYAFYPMIDGVFLDEYENVASPSDLAYYSDVYSYIKSKGVGPRTVIGNPGTAADEAYTATTDILVIFEDPSDYAAAAPDSYVVSGRYPASRFAMIQLDQGSAAGMIANLDLAQQRNTGVVFITNDTETGFFGNAYDTLPSYWSQEVSEVVARQTTPPGSGGEGGNSDSGGGGPMGPTSLVILLMALLLRHRKTAAAAVTDDVRRQALRHRSRY